MARPALEGIETAVVGRAFAAKFAAPLELADADVELLDRGDDDAGPYQSPMEVGMQHFHEFYRREMGLRG